MYVVAQTETFDASRKLAELNQRRLKEAIKLEELKLKEYEAQELAEKEKQNIEQARRETESMRDRAKREIAQRREAKRKTARDAKEKEKRSKQFQQELEILSKIRHPHLVLLLGACPEQGALVYEYMENGSLEDRVFQVNNSPPIPWFERLRIAWEVTAALVFLHKSKPKPIIHRDLKPANILLDHNFVSKVGDVGL